MRALLYCRQSDTSDAGEDSLSLESQEAELRQRAIKEGWIVVGTASDPDLKGYHDETKRKGLAEALERARRHEYDILLVWDISRFARKLSLQETLIDRLTACGVDVVSHTEPWVATPMFRQILGSVAEEQTRTVTKHIRRAMAERRRRGLPGGQPPYGFQRGEPKKGYIPDPETLSIAVEIHRRFAAGESMNDLMADLSRRRIASPLGLTQWRYGTLRKILRNPIYCGMWRDGADLVPVPAETLLDGAPLVDRATWDRVQDRLQSRQRAPKRKNMPSWLEGMIEHSCGLVMYLAPKTVKTYCHFRCKSVSHKDRHANCGVYPRTIDARKAERLVREALARDLAGLRSPAAAVADARRQMKAAAPLVDRMRRELDGRERQATARRQTAEDLHLSGRRDRAWFDVEDARVDAELAAIAAERARLPVVEEPEVYRDLHRLMRDVRLHAEGMPPATLGAILRQLGTVVVGSDGVTIRYNRRAEALLRPVSGRVIIR